MLVWFNVSTNSLSTTSRKLLSACFGPMFGMWFLTFIEKLIVIASTRFFTLQQLQTRITFDLAQKYNNSHIKDTGPYTFNHDNIKEGFQNSNS